MKNTVFWDVTSCGSSKKRVSEEPSASIIKVTRIGELRKTLALTSNRRMLQRNTVFLQDPHGVISQKTAFFICKYLLSVRM
jgi:hypothetical protein